MKEKEIYQQESQLRRPTTIRRGVEREKKETNNNNTYNVVIIGPLDVGNGRPAKKRKKKKRWFVRA